MQDSIVQLPLDETVVIEENLISHDESAEADASQPASAYLNFKAWTIRAAKRDSIAKAREDSIVRSVNDSLARVKSGYGLILEDPYYMASQKEFRQETSHISGAGGASWLYAVMALLFCLICYKSKGNPRYFRHLLLNLNEVKLRHNMFDSTVRESSYLFILNMVWVICAGILLWSVMPEFEGMEAVLLKTPLLVGVGICVGVALVYKVLMLMNYLVAGNVFTDYRTAKEWIKGANSENGLEALFLFPLALLSLIYPEWNMRIMWISVGVIGVGKILFIFKGFRIFVNRFSSFLLFLYYLCILEIIPIILAICGARMLLNLSF